MNNNSKVLYQVKTKLIFLLGISVFVFLFPSCEGNTDYAWIVENASSTIIGVNTNHIFYSGESNISIESGQNEIIAISNKLGGDSTRQEPIDVFSQFLITNASGDTLKKDYTVSSNWEINIEQVKKTPSFYKHDYKLLVTDEDF